MNRRYLIIQIFYLQIGKQIDFVENLNVWNLISWGVTRKMGG